jgi:hypothetical protein
MWHIAYCSLPVKFLYIPIILTLHVSAVLSASGILMHFSNHNSILLGIHMIHFSWQVCLRTCSVSGSKFDLYLNNGQSSLQPQQLQKTCLKSTLRKWSRFISLVVMAPKGIFLILILYISPSICGDMGLLPSDMVMTGNGMRRRRIFFVHIQLQFPRECYTSLQTR